MQWGTASFNGGDTYAPIAQTVSFPYPFTNGCSSIAITDSKGSLQQIWSYSNPSKTDFVIQNSSPWNQSGVRQCTWIAIGY